MWTAALPLPGNWKMTRFSQIAILLLLMLAPIRSRAQELPFRAGECADLIVNYRYGIKADIIKARMELSEEEGDFRASIIANTTKFWDSVYRVRDTFSCRFTPAGTPVSYLRHVNEGDYWAKALCIWNADASGLRLVGDKRNRPHRDTTYSDPLMVRDIINLIYHLRTVDPETMTEPVPYLLIVDKDLIDARIRFIGREEKKIAGLGVVHTLKYGATMHTRKGYSVEEDTQYTIDATNADSKEKMFFWFSDDGNRLPVFFTRPLSVGSINGRTVGFGGLIYPLSALKEE